MSGSCENTPMRTASSGLVCLLPLLVCAAGCWQPRYFAPRENRNGYGPGGAPAAVYNVVRDGDPGVAGEVRLWSDGAVASYTEQDEEVVDVHLGFEIENTGERPLRIDPAAIVVEELFVDGLLQERLVPTVVSGSGDAAPGTTSRLDLSFRPPTTRPAAVDGFAVRFGVGDGTGEVFEQVTPFAPWVRASRSWFVTSWGPGYGPGWGPGWSYGSSWGWGFGPRCW